MACASSSFQITLDSFITCQRASASHPALGKVSHTVNCMSDRGKKKKKKIETPPFLCIQYYLAQKLASFFSLGAQVLSISPALFGHLPAASSLPARAWRRNSRCHARAEVPEIYCGSPGGPCWRSRTEKVDWSTGNAPPLFAVSRLYTRTFVILVHKKIDYSEGDD